MALSNAERQKRYRLLRNEKASEHQNLLNENQKLKAENDQLRNEVDHLREKLRAARNNFPQNASSDIRQGEEPVRPFKPKLKKVLKENQFYYVQEGRLKLLARPVTVEDLHEAGIQCVPYSKVDKKYGKQIEKLVELRNAELVSIYNEKVAAWNAVCESIGEEQLELVLPFPE